MVYETLENGCGPAFRKKGCPFELVCFFLDTKWTVGSTFCGKNWNGIQTNYVLDFQTANGCTTTWRKPEIATRRIYFWSGEKKTTLPAMYRKFFKLNYVTASPTHMREKYLQTATKDFFLPKGKDTLFGDGRDNGNPNCKMSRPPLCL